MGDLIEDWDVRMRERMRERVCIACGVGGREGGLKQWSNKVWLTGGGWECEGYEK